MSDYKEYILQHSKGALEAWENKLKPRVVGLVPYMTIQRVGSLLEHHDESKILLEEEYIPYSKHFRDPESCPKDSEEYKRAWNHHQKTNPHHWQYWVVLEDIVDPKVYALEMDFEYVMEMLCDWQSASTYYGHTAHWWYETQKNNMILHPKTRELIEEYLKYLD